MLELTSFPLQFIEWITFIYYGVSVSERLFAMICSILPTVNSADEQKTTQHTGLHGEQIMYVFICFIPLLHLISSLLGKVDLQFIVRAFSMCAGGNFSLLAVHVATETIN